jgi:ABC-type multidrug transport system fused ATPase/permease subunit
MCVINAAKLIGNKIYPAFARGYDYDVMERNTLSLGQRQLLSLSVPYF